MNLSALADRVLLNTYGPRKLSFVRGRGVWVWDSSGKKYLDLLGGVAVNSLGHCHPAVVRAIRAQAGKIIHTSNLYQIGPQVHLAEMLVGATFADRVFFCNSGTEANEAALKLARKYFFLKKEKRDRLLAFENSFHGRTTGSLALTMQEKYQKAFRPLIPADTARFNRLDDADRKITKRTAAVFVELIQGEGGMQAATATFLAGLRRMCADRGAILVYDEVQTGNGRTGELFAYKHFGDRLAPDLLTTAKGLAGGVPIGALLARKPYADAFQAGDHAATFGGNFLACAAGCAAFSVISSGRFLKTARDRAAVLWGELQKISGWFPEKIDCLLGLGHMVGLKLRPPYSAKPLREKLHARRVLTGISGESVLRLTPPLVISEKEIRLAARIIAEEVRAL